MNTYKAKSPGVVLLALWLSACAQIGERPLTTDFATRPELGIRLRIVTGEDVPAKLPLIPSRQSPDRLPSQALLVVRVTPEQSADRAGIRVGDYVLALYGNKVSGMRDSVALMQDLRWGDDIVVRILRDSEVQEIWVPLRP